MKYLNPNNYNEGSYIYQFLDLSGKYFAFYDFEKEEYKVYDLMDNAFKDPTVVKDEFQYKIYCDENGNEYAYEIVSGYDIPLKYLDHESLHSIVTRDNSEVISIIKNEEKYYFLIYNIKEDIVDRIEVNLDSIIDEENIVISQLVDEDIYFTNLYTTYKFNITTQELIKIGDSSFGYKIFRDIICIC